MIQIKQLQETEITLLDIYIMIQIVYKDRVRQGMNFWATTVSFDDFKKEYERNSAVVFVAIDDTTLELLGSGTIYIRTKGKVRYAHLTNAVVLPKVHRCGIGSKLKAVRQQFAIQKGCEYISCTTAVNAESSVLWHKKNGYKIVGKSYWLGYYSYRFRLQITPSLLWNNSLFCRLMYITSCIRLYINMCLNNKFNQN